MQSVKEKAARTQKRRTETADIAVGRKLTGNWEGTGEGGESGLAVQVSQKNYEFIYKRQGKWKKKIQ
jgi:hypothetical protein